MFGSRPLCQFADDWQHVSLVVTSFYHHKDGNAEEQRFQQVSTRTKWSGRASDSGRITQLTTSQAANR